MPQKGISLRIFENKSLKSTPKGKPLKVLFKDWPIFILKELLTATLNCKTYLFLIRTEFRHSRLVTLALLVIFNKNKKP